MIRILSLDDDPDLLELYSLIFGRSGYDHLGSADSCEAWVLLHADRFDLFTQDMSRPDVPGWEYLKAIEEDSALASLPIVVISDRAQEADKITALKNSRIDDYLGKPVGPHELVESVQRVCLRHGLTPPVSSSWDAVRARWADVRTKDKRRGHAAEFSSHICAALQDADPDVRLTAAKFAAALNDRNAIEPLLKLLNDPIRDVANTGLRALGQLNDLVGRATLLPLLHHSDWRLRCLAALALKSDKDDAVGSALSLLLDDEVHLVKLAATLALKRHSQKEIVEALSAQLLSSDAWLRAATVATLRSIRKPWQMN